MWFPMSPIEWVAIAFQIMFTLRETICLSGIRVLCLLVNNVRDSLIFCSGKIVEFTHTHYGPDEVARKPVEYN